MKYAGVYFYSLQYNCFMLPMLVRYTVYDVDIPFPSLFTYPANVWELLCYLIPGLPYPSLFLFSGFPLILLKLQCTSLHIFLKAMIIISRSYHILMIPVIY